MKLCTEKPWQKIFWFTNLVVRPTLWINGQIGVLYECYWMEMWHWSIQKVAVTTERTTKMKNNFHTANKSNVDMVEVINHLQFIFFIQVEWKTFSSKQCKNSKSLCIHHTALGTSGKAEWMFTAITLTVPLTKMIVMISVLPHPKISLEIGSLIKWTPFSYQVLLCWTQPAWWLGLLMKI